MFWVLFTLGLLLAGSLAVVGFLRLSQATAASRGQPARSATARQERRIRVPTDPTKRRWRLVAGRGKASHRRLAGEDCVSAVAFGPTGRGRPSA